MGYRQTTVSSYCDTVAHIQAWMTEIHNMFLAAGWQQTADAGQIDIPSWTITISGTTGNGIWTGNLNFGWECWKSTDSLSSTFPIYVTVTYGAGYTLNCPSVRFNVSTGSVGTGSCTTGTMGATGSSNTGTANASAYEMDAWWSTLGGSLGLGLWVNATGGTTSNARLLVVERSHDANGNDTDDYYTVTFHSKNYVMMSSYWNPVKWAPFTSVSWENIVFPCGLPSGTTSAACGPYIQAGLIYPELGYIGNPMTMLVCFKSVDVPAQGVVIPVNIYGGTRNYLINKHAQLNSLVPGGTASGALGFRWEA